jgi:hypothetical protein
MATSDYLDQVQKLYIAYFGRPADPLGLSYWANQVNAAGGNMAVAIAGFAVSSESTNLFGALPSAQKISAIYLNLFNRLPESTGLSYWMNQLDSGAITQAQAAWEIMNQAGAGDATSVANKLVMANVFTAQVDTAAEIAGYNGAQPAAYGRAYLAGVDATPGSVSNATTSLNNSVADATGVRPTSPVVTTPGTPTPPSGDQVFTFTTVADNFTGGKGNDSFNGLIDTTTPANSTITAADKIEGGAGIDTLSITVTGTGETLLPGLTLSNVEKLSIRDQNTSGKLSTYDVQGTGITDVTSNVSTASGGLQFANLVTGATLTVLGDKATQVANVQFSMANASDTVSLVLDGGLQDTVLSGQTTVTNLNGQASSATIVSNGAANTLGVITLAGNAGDTITTLTLNANTDLTATLVATDYSSKAALTVTGAGKVNLGSTVGFDGSTIDASANSGGLTIGLSGNVQTYKGSSGADIVSGTTPVADNASIDGGAGVDTLSATLINSTNGAAFKNFEVLDLTGLSTTVTQDFAQLSNSAFTGVILNNTKTATTTLNNVTETADGFNLTVLKGSSGSHTTLNFDSASVSGTNDVLNIIYNGSGSTQLGALTAQGIETVKIAAGGVGSFNGVNLTDDSAKLISITGDQTYSMTVQAQGNITGSSVSQLTKIDASLATGSVGITTNAATATNGQSALTVLGGSGVNTFDVATSAVSGSQGITITTGLGNDTVTLSRATLQNVTDATKLQFTTVTDLQSGDVLNFGTTVNFQTTAVNVTGAADLRAALTTAIGSGNGNIAGAVSWFQFAGETYAVMNKLVGDGLTNDDIVVKLSGVTDLSGMQASGATLTL